MRKLKSWILSGENLATVINFVSTTDFRVVDNQLYIFIHNPSYGQKAASVTSFRSRAKMTLQSE